MADQGQWECKVTYDLGTDHNGDAITRELSENLFLDIPCMFFMHDMKLTYR